MQAFERNVDSGFFLDLALSASGGGFPVFDIQLASDRGDEALVWGFGTLQKQQAAVLVSEIAQASQAVGERAAGRRGLGGIDCVFGHGGGYVVSALVSAGRRNEGGIGGAFASVELARRSFTAETPLGR